MFRGLIDYAGLFPPAELSLPAAFAAYQEYRRGPDAWMLGKFICPEGKLPELLGLLARDEGTRFLVLEISALPAIDWNDADAVARSFAGLADVRERSHGRASVSAVEIKLPDALPIDVAVSRVADALPTLNGAAVFLEPASSIAGIDNLVQTLARGPMTPALGLKLRCGGVTPAAFPEPSVVAHALTRCRDHRIPFKATAGLHHPLRHHRAEPQLDVWMHGFVNVFGAAVLAHAENLDEATIGEIVEETDPPSFSWTHDAFGWRNLSVDARQLEKLRAALVVSFGSCSFDEPREDLRALGWLR